MKLLTPGLSDSYGRISGSLSILRGLLSLLIFLIVLLGINVSIRVYRTPLPPVPKIWGEKPVLGYMTLTPSLEESLLTGSKLHPDEFDLVQRIAVYENYQIQILESESLEIINDPTLTIDQKRRAIIEMGFNARVEDILRATNTQLKISLDTRTYHRLIGWIEWRWKIERYLHGNVRYRAAARSSQVFATRYDANGAYVVALPDKCLKFANAGNHICDGDGYAVGQDYSVILSYKKSTGATVLEAGPWNVDDNYWSGWGDPQPRRMFTDLQVGMPEAQAAYFNGYNGGLDQYGRKVTAPFGIDLAREVSIDIGLEPGKNDWITVSYMWTENWGKGSAGKQQNGTSSAQPGVAAAQPVRVATAGADGSIIHKVETGQTLWTIAAAYQLSLPQLLERNSLTKDAVIFPGQELVIQKTGSTPLPTVGVTTIPLPTQIDSVTPTERIGTIESPLSSTYLFPGTATRTPSATSEQGNQNPLNFDPVWVAIVLLLVGGLIILGLGYANKLPYK